VLKVSARHRAPAARCSYACAGAAAHNVRAGRAESLPAGGMERAWRLWRAIPSHLSDEERLEHLAGVIRLIDNPRAT